jgi:predicted RNase H-like HicB family nuclease
MRLFWSEKDDAFIAEVPELPGCMADGRTYSEAVANVETVIDHWIRNGARVGTRDPGASRQADVRSSCARL